MPVEETETNVAGGLNMPVMAAPPIKLDQKARDLMQAAESTTELVTKAVASEIKNLRNPPDEVVQVIITVADFVDG